MALEQIEQPFRSVGRTIPQLESGWGKGAMYSLARSGLLLAYMRIDPQSIADPPLRPSEGSPVVRYHLPYAQAVLGGLRPLPGSTIPDSYRRELMWKARSYQVEIAEVVNKVYDGLFAAYPAQRDEYDRPFLDAEQAGRAMGLSQRELRPYRQEQTGVFLVNGLACNFGWLLPGSRRTVIGVYVRLSQVAKANLLELSTR